MPVRLKFSFWILLVPICCSCFDTNGAEQTFVGSTPADVQVRTILNVPADPPVDFIRWQLVLANNKTFSLGIIYGESKPNTLGFKEDHELSFEGSYIVSGWTGSAMIYEFSSKSFRSPLKMVGLNANLLHILNGKGNLMIGDGGWSYTLSNSNPAKVPVALYRSPHARNDESPEQVYDGRTPCKDIASEYGLKVSGECFKLKWRLILYRDSVSGAPTSYVIRKIVDNASQNVTGKWAIIEGSSENPHAVIYQLEPDDAANTMYLLSADEGVLFFLKKDRSYFTGNKDFSWALNRKDPTTK
jgi:hypothetical protein